MNKIAVFLFMCSSLLLVGTLNAQQIDAQFGLSWFHTPSAASLSPTSTDHLPQSLSNGVYPSIAADFILVHNLGFNGEVTWKGSRALYQGFEPYRPIMYDFNAVYAKKVTRVGFALMGGIGAESIRFYQNQIVSCNGISCTNYVSSNHFLAHVGGALRLYATHSVYIAPEIHEYFVHNNLEFTSAAATRYGLNVGFTFGR